jgi:hypothetical protein
MQVLVALVLVGCTLVAVRDLVAARVLAGAWFLAAGVVLTRLDTLQSEQMKRTKQMETASEGEYLPVLWGFSLLYRDR